ncbi:MAG: preprotein translocase subunit YajC [Phycisphaerae bacterium]|nr:preprotein translocase subunit YajC [Phycisphaerae bacterium]
MDNTFLYMVLGLVAVMFIMTIFSGRRQKRQRETMLGNLKKHDRVMTSGGIIGSVVEIKPRTIVLKVDEGSNTRITFSREAIQQVIEESAETPAAESKT